MWPWRWFVQLKWQEKLGFSVFLLICLVIVLAVVGAFLGSDDESVDARSVVATDQALAATQRAGETPRPSSTPKPTSAPLDPLAVSRRSAFIDATMDGCLAAINRYADQFASSEVARFRNNECPSYAEFAAKDLQDAYESIGHPAATGNVWLDDKNVNYEAELAAAPEYSCDHMVNVMEDMSWEQRFRSLTDDGFPSRFCFDLD